MSETTPLDSGRRAELIALYQIQASNLEFFKRQQWQVTHYCLLVYAALYGVGYVAELKNGLVPILIGLAALLFAVRVVEDLEERIDVARSRMKKVRRLFSVEFRLAHAGGNPDRARVLELLHSVLILGWVLLVVAWTSYTT